MGLSTDLGHGLFDWFRPLPVRSLASYAGLRAGDVLRHFPAGMIILISGRKLKAGLSGVLAPLRS